MAAPRSTHLVGRDAELETLVSTLGIRAPRAGVPGVLLGGDAGVGKTRLLTELRDLAVGQGWRVVAGHCLDLADSTLPYLPFSEILGRLLADEPEVVARVTERHPTLARLQPGRRLRGGDDQDSGLALDRGNVFNGVHDLLETMADQAPLLVVVEDAHWADQSTRDMLSFLFSRAFDGPVALVVSFRSDDLHRRHPLRPQVAEWTRLRGVERHQLEPLSSSDVRRLVKQLRPGTLSEAELVAIESRAEGNPFFVEELVGASGAGGLPVELADVLIVRLDRLDDDAREVARLASVAGRQVSHELLTAVSVLDQAALERGVRSAVESNVLVPVRDSAYSFRHALLGEAVYDDLLPGERARLHAAFVDALCCERAVGTNAELAQHARRAGNHAVALRARIAAGNEAMAVGGPNEAAAHFLDALEILAALDEPPDGVDESALVRRCAEAFVAAGQVSRAVKVLRHHLDGLPADVPAEERGQLLTAIAAAMLLTDSTESPEKVADEAVALLTDGPPPLLARALAVRAQCLGRWNAQEAREVAMEALALAERHGLTALVVDLTTTLASLGSAGVDDQAQAGQLQSAWWTAVERARAEGLVEPELRALFFLARLHQDLGAYDDALEVFAQMMARAEQSGLQWSPYPAEARALRAIVLMFQGRLDEADALLDVTGQDPPLVYEWLYFAIQMTICTLRGRTHGDAFDRLRAHWSRDGLIAVAAGTAELLAAQQRRDVEAAQAVYDRVVATLRPLWQEWFQARLRLSTLVLGIHADVASSQTTDQREAAREAVERLFADGERVMEFYAQFDEVLGPEYHAWVQRRTAEHLRWRWSAQVDPPSRDELVSAWRATEAAFESYGDVPELTATRVRLAGVLRTTGDAAGARRVADLAREAAHAMDAAPMLAELTALGSTPTPRDAGQQAVLTAREAEILALVAEGRTNGEIGKQLFIATKTVSVHVSNILGKLGAASRTEAAAVARRQGLV